MFAPARIFAMENAGGHVGTSLRILVAFATTINARPWEGLNPHQDMDSLGYTPGMDFMWALLQGKAGRGIS